MRPRPLDLRLESKLMLGRDARRAMASSAIRISGTHIVPRDTTTLLMQQIEEHDCTQQSTTVLPMDFYLHPNWRER